MFYECYVGVTFFFVLSGLLITLRYSDEIINYKTYFVNRFARIYPMWFLLTLLTFLFTFSNNFEWFRLLFVNLTFLKGFSNDLKMTGIDAGWTLTVEECFYFLAPVLIYLLTKKKILLLILPIVFIIAGAILHYFFTAIDLPAFQNFNFIFLYTIFGRSWEFLIGIFAALLFKKHKERIISFYNNNFGLNTLFIICIISVIGLLAYIKEPWYNDATIGGVIISNFILPIFIVLFYLGLMVKKDLWNKVIASKPFIVGGKASFTFYLIHQGIIHTNLTQLLDKANINMFRYPIEFCLIAGLSILLYYYVEAPLNKKIKLIFMKRKMI